MLRGRAYLALGDIDNAAHELDDALATSDPGRHHREGGARARGSGARTGVQAAVTALRPLYQDDKSNGEVAAALAAALRTQGSADAVAEALKILDSAAGQGRLGAGADRAGAPASMRGGPPGRRGAPRCLALDKSPHSREARLEDAPVRFDWATLRAAACRRWPSWPRTWRAAARALWAARPRGHLGRRSRRAPTTPGFGSAGEALKVEIARERGRLALAKKTASASSLSSGARCPGAG